MSPDAVMSTTLLDSGSSHSNKRQQLDARHMAVWPTYVDGDVPRVYSSLDLPHLGVLPSAPEEPGGFHSEVAYLQKEVQALVTCILNCCYQTPQQLPGSIAVTILEARGDLCACTTCEEASLIHLKAHNQQQQRAHSCEPTLWWKREK